MEEVDRPREEDDTVARAVGIVAELHARVARLAAIDFGRAGHRLAALQALDDEGVARARHRARTPIARDDQRVLVFPRDILLRFGQREATGYELPGCQVELARGDRIFAAIGQEDEAALLGERLAIRALPHPIGLFHGTQRVEVEHLLPGDGRLCVSGNAGGAPDAADMAGILPEIIDLTADQAGHRDPVGRFRDLQRVGEQRGIGRIGFEDG